MKWGETASKADITRIDKPLPFLEDNNLREGRLPWHGSYTHMLCDRYIEAIDHPFIQMKWRPGWGDIYLLRTGDDRLPNRRLPNIWTLRMSVEDFHNCRDSYMHDYCWLPSLGQLIGILAERKLWVAVVMVDRKEGYWRAGIEGKKLYDGEDYTPELAMAQALSQFTERLRK